MLAAPYALSLCTYSSHNHHSMLKCSVRPHWNTYHQLSHKLQYSFFTSFFPLVKGQSLILKKLQFLPSYSFLLLCSPPLPLVAKYPEFSQSCHSHFLTSCSVHPFQVLLPKSSMTAYSQLQQSSGHVTNDHSFTKLHSTPMPHSPVFPSCSPFHPSYLPGSCFTSCPMLGFPKILFSTVFALSSCTHNYVLYFPYHL